MVHWETVLRLGSEELLQHLHGDHLINRPMEVDFYIFSLRLSSSR